MGKIHLKNNRTNKGSFGHSLIYKRSPQWMDTDLFFFFFKCWIPITTFQGTFVPCLKHPKEEMFDRKTQEVTFKSYF